MKKKPLTSWANITWSIKGNSIFHGNYVVDSDTGITWDTGIEERSLPDSFYLTSKPEWFGDLEWPPFGGDLMPGNTGQIPPEVRYWAIQDALK